MRRAVSLFSVLASLALSGCGSHFQYWKQAPRTSIHSIVSLSPSTTEIIGSNSFSALKGRTAADNWPATVKNVEVVASVKPDYEKVRAIQPDLIIYDASLYSPGDIEKIKALHFDTFEIKATTVPEFENELWALGDMIAQQTNIGDYVARIDSSVGTAKGDPPKPTPKVVVLMPGRGGAPMISGTKSFIGEVVRIAGGQPVGPEVDRFVPANPEVLIAANPDVILVPTTPEGAAKDIDSILKDARFQSIQAVRSKNVKALDQDVVLRRGSRVDKFVDAAHLAIASKGGS